ncbi:MAG: hypothetical protein ACTSXC_07315 [Candidatus Freyarchaeota archaeon]
MLYPVKVEPKRIPLVKRLLARMHPIPYYIDKEHFKAPMVIYLAYCKKHKVYFLDYLHGFDGYVSCPLCLAEYKERVERKVLEGTVL